jgi:hypothetical protein
LAPWFLGLSIGVLAVGWYFEISEFWLGPFWVLVGLAIGLQGVDAIRTGRLIGRFPNSWPVDAERDYEPVGFWVASAIYLVIGALFTTFGILVFLERASAR